MWAYKLKARNAIYSDEYPVQFTHTVWRVRNRVSIKYDEWPSSETLKICEWNVAMSKSDVCFFLSPKPLMWKL